MSAHPHAFYDCMIDGRLLTSASSAGRVLTKIDLAGGIRTDLVYAASGSEGNGVVTYGEAFAVQPFSNNLVTVTLTGAQIRTALEQQFSAGVARILLVSSGFTYTYTWDAPSKTGTIDAASIRLSGAPLDANATYRVTINSFLAGGGDGFAVFKDGTDRLSGGFDLDALVDYLGKSDPTAPPPADRISGNGCVP